MPKAILTEYGKQRWADVFPEGTLPVKSYVPVSSNVGNIYLVDWAAITEEQRQAVLQKLADRFNISKREVEMQVLQDGLPIRAELVTVAIPFKFFV
jgi:hypothetical protein